MQAPIAEPRALLQLQAHDAVIDRLEHRRGALPENAPIAVNSLPASACSFANFMIDGSTSSPVERMRAYVFCGPSLRRRDCMGFSGAHG